MGSPSSLSRFRPLDQIYQTPALFQEIFLQDLQTSIASMTIALLQANSH